MQQPLSSKLSASEKMDNRKIVLLCEANLNTAENVAKILEFVCGSYTINVDKYKSLFDKIRRAVLRYKSKWQESFRNKTRFNARF